MKISGVWIPLVTPFKDSKIDYQSLSNIINFYIGQGISGLVPLATTGEAPTISDEEYFKILEKTIEVVNGRVPVIVGVSGNDTKRVIERVQALKKYPLAGVLVPCPYYNRPDQRGIYEHFKAVSQASAFNVIIYNIPYRTGRNIENKTINQLAKLPNVRGLKDSCGDIRQSMELLLSPPPDFSILTGEDVLFFDMLCLGGDGGILASAHIATKSFVALYNSIKSNDLVTSRNIWRRLAPLVPTLFEEPNPAPVKYCLSRMNLIASDAVRLPLTGITEELKTKLNRQLETFL